jgi:hypothetical protein
MTGGDGSVPNASFAAALDGLAQVLRDVTAEVEQAPDKQAAFEAASVLTEMLRRATNTAADLRAKIVAGIADEESLSLALLADRIGVSKARAGQLMQSARRTQQAGEQEADDA